MSDAIPLSRYLRRHVDHYLDELTAQLPALLVVGPRAAGKTTTLARRARTVVRLDRENEAVAFRADPDAALRALAEPVLIDEWQNVPGVLGAVRRSVEANPTPGRFFVTGSVRAELEHEVWPATGRLVRVEMFPMTVREQRGRLGGASLIDRVINGAALAPATPSLDLRDYVALALRSGFPTPALRLDGVARQAWLESYLEDMLTHDVAQLEEPRTRPRDPQRLRRYFEACALNSGGAPDHRTIYDAAGINRVTANAYEALLLDLFIVDRVPAWVTNRLRRLTQLPKRYVVDVGVMAAALRVDEAGVLADGDLLGRVLDTFVAAQLRPELAAAPSMPRLHHIRTEQGRHEVDLLAELGGGRIVAVEVKASSAPQARDARHLEWLSRELGDRFVGGVVLHTGPRAYQLAPRVTATPISTLWADS